MTELKSGHFLREKHRHALEWVLGSSGPLHGTAKVFVAEKSRIAAAALLGSDIVPSDPLVPALAVTASWWGRAGERVDVTHDLQRTLTEPRVTVLRTLLAGRGVHLGEVLQRNSRSDPRIQLADYLAGIARSIASNAIAGRGDAELMRLIEPYILPGSLLAAR